MPSAARCASNAASDRQSISMRPGGRPPGFLFLRDAGPICPGSPNARLSPVVSLCPTGSGKPLEYDGLPGYAGPTGEVAEWSKALPC
jgi:hypothetical protein